MRADMLNYCVGRSSVPQVSLLTCGSDAVAPGEAPEPAFLMSCLMVLGLEFWLLTPGSTRSDFVKLIGVTLAKGFEFSGPLFSESLEYLVERATKRRREILHFLVCSPSGPRVRTGLDRSSWLDRTPTWSPRWVAGI